MAAKKIHYIDPIDPHYTVCGKYFCYDDRLTWVPSQATCKNCKRALRKRSEQGK